MSYILMNEFLKDRHVLNSHPDVVLFLKEQQIERFEDITQDKLREFGRHYPTSIWNVIRILGFMGLKFQGKLHPYSSVDFQEEIFLCYKGDLSREALLKFSYRLEHFLHSFLQSFGLARICDLEGIYLPNIQQKLEKLQMIEFFNTFVEELKVQEFVLGSLRQQQVAGFDETQSIPNQEQSKSDESVKTVRFEQEVIEIPAALFDISIDKEDYSSFTKRNLFFLLRDSFDTYSKLPSDLMAYFMSKPQIGMGKIMRFKDELIQNIQKYHPQSLSSNSVSIGTIGAAGQLVVEEPKKMFIPKFLAEISVDGFLFVGETNKYYQSFIIQAQSLGIQCWGDLGQYTWNEFAELIRKKHTRMKQLQDLLESFRISMDGKQNEIDIVSIWQDYRTLINDFINGNKAKQIGEKHWYTLVERIDCSAEKNAKTLQEISKELGVTRERIRQMEKKSINTLLFRFAPMLLWMKTQVDERKGVVSLTDVLQFPVELSDMEGRVFEGILNKCSLDLWYDAEYQVLVTIDKERLQEKKTHFIQILIHDRRWFYGNQLDEKIKAYFKEHSCLFLSEDKVKVSIIPEYFTVYHSIYFYNQGTKKDLLLPVFEAFFPEGLAIIKQSQQFTDIVRELYPYLFSDNDERSIYSALLRNEEDVLIWDNGYYVPRSFIQVLKEDLTSIKDWTINKLVETKVPQIRLTVTLWKFKNQCDQLGITNEYALYTCLRLYFSDQFEFIKAPRVCLKGNLDEAKQPLTQIFNEFMKAQKGKVTKKEIYDTFMHQMGWEWYHIEQRMGDLVIRAGYDEYIHVDNLNINISGLEIVKNWLVKKIKMLETVVSIKIVNRAIMNLANIDSHHLLYYILEREYSDTFSFYIYPKIGLFDTEAEAFALERRSKLALLEKKFVDENRILNRSELESYFHSIGWDNSDFGLITYYSENILVYFQQAAYVHKETIGLDQKKIEDFLSYINLWFDQIHQENQSLLDVQKLVDDPTFMEQMPVLYQDISWSDDLMVSIIRLFPEKYLVLGTSNKVVVRVDNPHNITSEIDLIDYILRQEFQGATSLRMMEQRLVKYNLIVKNISKYYLNAELDESMPYITTPTEIMTHEVFRVKG